VIVNSGERVLKERIIRGIQECDGIPDLIGTLSTEVLRMIVSLSLIKSDPVKEYEEIMGHSREYGLSVLKLEIQALDKSKQH
jgi:hypothetical protein